jgi:hypothetical protein
MAVDDRQAAVIGGMVEQTEGSNGVFIRPNSIGGGQVIASSPIKLFHGEPYKEGHSLKQKTVTIAGLSLCQAIKRAPELWESVQRIFGFCVTMREQISSFEQSRLDC